MKNFNELKHDVLALPPYYAVRDGLYDVGGIQIMANAGDDVRELALRLLTDADCTCDQCQAQLRKISTAPIAGTKP